MLSGTSTEEKISIEIPKQITDPLTFLISLQSLFSTDGLKRGYESWRYEIGDPNRFCISTNENGQFVLQIKSGYMTFYKSDGRWIENVNLASKEIWTVLEKFCRALEKAAYCEVRTTEYESGNDNKKVFTYRFRYEEGKIVRYFLDSEDHSSWGGSGDL